MEAALKESSPFQAQATSEFTLTDGQEQALHRLEAARRNPDINQFTLLGYPGTGKTTIISRYANTLRSKGVSVAVSAPTNKATRILMKKVGRNTGIEFASIQSLLGLRMEEKEDGTQDCVRKSDSKLNAYSVVIVDECSMVSRDLFREITAYQGETFIIFVGDPYQLPPVESAHDAPKISPSFQDRDHWSSYTLSEVVRQASDNPIITLATAIRESESRFQRFDARSVHELLSRIQDPRLFMIHQEDIPIFAQGLIRRARAEGRTDLPVRIVAWRNARVQTYNRLMHEELAAQDAPPGAYFAPGEFALAHQEFEGVVYSDLPMYDPHQDKVVKKRTVVERRRIIISEEGTITGINRASHPDHPNLDAWEVSFLPEDEEHPVYAYVPVDPAAFRDYLNQLWANYRELRSQKNVLAKALHNLEKSGASGIDIFHTKAAYDAMTARVTEASRLAWSVQKSHGKLRHAYASTAHKAQGSTWDTTIVDLSDLSQMPNDRDYNRALYVAVTRSSGSLAIAL